MPISPSFLWHGLNTAAMAPSSDENYVGDTPRIAFAPLWCVSARLVGRSEIDPLPDFAGVGTASCYPFARSECRRRLLTRPQAGRRGPQRTNWRVAPAESYSRGQRNLRLRPRICPPC